MPMDVVNSQAFNHDDINALHLTRGETDYAQDYPVISIEFDFIGLHRLHYSCIQRRSETAYRRID